MSCGRNVLNIPIEIEPIGEHFLVHKIIIKVTVFQGRPCKSESWDFSQLHCPTAITFHVVWILGFFCAEKAAPLSRRSPSFTFLAPLPAICIICSPSVDSSKWQFQLSRIARSMRACLTLTQQDVFYTESCLSCCCLNQNSLELKASSTNFSFDIHEVIFF